MVLAETDQYRERERHRDRDAASRLGGPAAHASSSSRPAHTWAQCAIHMTTQTSEYDIKH